MSPLSEVCRHNSPKYRFTQCPKHDTNEQSLNLKNTRNGTTPCRRHEVIPSALKPESSSKRVPANIEKQKRHTSPSHRKTSGQTPPKQLPYSSERRLLQSAAHAYTTSVGSHGVIPSLSTIQHEVMDMHQVQLLDVMDPVEMTCALLDLGAIRVVHLPQLELVYPEGNHALNRVLLTFLEKQGTDGFKDLVSALKVCSLDKMASILLNTERQMIEFFVQYMDARDAQSICTCFRVLPPFDCSPMSPDQTFTSGSTRQNEMNREAVSSSQKKTRIGIFKNNTPLRNTPSHSQDTPLVDFSNNRRSKRDRIGKRKKSPKKERTETLKRTLELLLNYVNERQMERDPSGGGYPSHDRVKRGRRRIRSPSPQYRVTNHGLGLVNGYDGAACMGDTGKPCIDPEAFSLANRVKMLEDRLIMQENLFQATIDGLVTKSLQHERIPKEQLSFTEAMDSYVLPKPAYKHSWEARTVHNKPFSDRQPEYLGLGTDTSSSDAFIENRGRSRSRRRGSRSYARKKKRYPATVFTDKEQTRTSDRKRSPPDTEENLKELRTLGDEMFQDNDCTPSQEKILSCEKEVRGKLPYSHERPDVTTSPEISSATAEEKKVAPPVKRPRRSLKNKADPPDTRLELNTEGNGDIQCREDRELRGYFQDYLSRDPRQNFTSPSRHSEGRQLEDKRTLLGATRCQTKTRTNDMFGGSSSGSGDVLFTHLDPWGTAKHESSDNTFAGLFETAVQRNNIDDRSSSYITLDASEGFGRSLSEIALLMASAGRREPPERDVDSTMLGRTCARAKNYQEKLSGTSEENQSSNKLHSAKPIRTGRFTDPAQLSKYLPWKTGKEIGRRMSEEQSWLSTLDKIDSLREVLN